MTSNMSAPQRPLTWFITGCAASGFGIELARLAQSHGHKVIATSRDPSRYPDVVAEIEGKGGKWLAMDLTDPNNAQTITDLENGGTAIDVLVNCAGRSLHGAVESFTDEETRLSFEIGFFGPFRLIQAAIPWMRKRRSGVIVNFSTGAAVDGRSTMGIYAGAKAALDGMARVLYKELAPFNIRLLTILLGAFTTDFSTSALISKAAPPEDYQGTETAMLYDMLSNRVRYPSPGDHVKATRAIYEVVTGTGVGEGHEKERVLVLGKDMVATQRGVEEQWEQTWKAFGWISENVNVDQPKAE